MAKKEYHKESVLRRLYFEEGLTQKEIGEKFGVSGVTIGQWMDKRGIDVHGDYPWREKEWLREQYCEMGKSIGEIAECVETSTATIHEWCKKHGIEVEMVEVPENNSVNNRSKLKELHHEKELSVNEIADELDVSRQTVKTRLEKFSIKRKYENGEHGSFATGPDGYEYFLGSRRGKVRLHRLLICLKNDPNDVFASNMDVHHVNGVKWDNRVSNLELLSKRDHALIHSGST